MATSYKVVLRLAVLLLVSVGALGCRIFLYTRDLPDIEHLTDFAPDSGNHVTDTCLPGLAFAIPFDRIGKPFRDAVASAEPTGSFSDQIARSLMCAKQESAGRYQLDVFRLSWHIRRRFSEAELMTIYLNRAYFGPATTGIENASDHFFQRSADTLSVEEAALLAGLLRGPDYYSPFKHPDRAIQRRNEILRRMQSQGKLSDAELTRAVALPIVTRALGNTEANPVPTGALKALAADEKEYCDEFEGDFKKGCAESFRTNLIWRDLPVTPQGRVAILVENRNISFCGSAGCALRLFIAQADGQFVQTLGTEGEVGAIDRLAILKTVTNGFYDIQKTWADRKTSTTYRWNGSRYSAD
jgi:hypothetical protein